MIKNTIEKLNNGENLTYDETKQTFIKVLSKEASTEEINDLITLLGSKKETASEIAGIVDAITSNMKIKTNKVVLNKLGLRKDYSNSLNF